MRMYYCMVCHVPYLSQREADLCTPASLIEYIYGEKSMQFDEKDWDFPVTWLEE